MDIKQRKRQGKLMEKQLKKDGQRSLKEEIESTQPSNFTSQILSGFGHNFHVVRNGQYEEFTIRNIGNDQVLHLKQPRLDTQGENQTPTSSLFTCPSPKESRQMEQ